MSILFVFSSPPTNTMLRGVVHKCRHYARCIHAMTVDVVYYFHLLVKEAQFNMDFPDHSIQCCFPRLESLLSVSLNMASPLGSVSPRKGSFYGLAIDYQFPIIGVALIFSVRNLAITFLISPIGSYEHVLSPQLACGVLKGRNHLLCFPAKQC